MVQARQMRPFAWDLHCCRFSIPCAGVQRFRLEMVSPFDAGIRRFRGHCCRIHRISTELEWSQRLPEFGYCRTCVRSVPAGDSWYCVANAKTNADEAPCSRRDFHETSRNCVAYAEAEAETETGRAAQAEAQGQAEAKADAHTEAEAAALATKGREPLHPHAARAALAQDPAVPAGFTDHDGARRAGRCGRPELPTALRVRATSPCLRSSCGTTCGRPSHRRMAQFARSVLARSRRT